MLLRNNWSIIKRTQWFKHQQSIIGAPDWKYDKRTGLAKTLTKRPCHGARPSMFFFFFWHTETRWVVLVNIFFLFFRQVATEKTFSVSSAWFQSKPEECWKDDSTTTKKVATFNVKDLTVFRTKIKAPLWFVGWLRHDKILHVSKSEAGGTTTTCYCVNVLLCLSTGVKMHVLICDTLSSAHGDVVLRRFLKITPTTKNMSP